MRWTTPFGVAFLTAAALGSFGCATRPVTVQQAAPLAATPAPVCAVSAPPYTLAQEQQLARETAALDQNSMLFTAMVDYGRMRKAARAACPKP